MHTAMYMIMGINIGACFSVILTTIGCSKTGWFCVCFHLFFNIVGLMLAAFMLKTGLLNFFIKINAPTDFKTALFHTFFNVMTTTFLFYFIPEIDKTKNIFLFKAKNAKEGARLCHEVSFVDKSKASVKEAEFLRSWRLLILQGFNKVFLLWKDLPIAHFPCRLPHKEAEHLFYAAFVLLHGFGIFGDNLGNGLLRLLYRFL